MVDSKLMPKDYLPQCLEKLKDEILCENHNGASLEDVRKDISLNYDEVSYLLMIMSWVRDDG